jgi:hypothetical protein
MKDIKLNDAQIEALSTFYMGVSAIADLYTAKGGDMSVESMKEFFDLIVEGANLTTASIATSTPKDIKDQIDLDDANIIDFEAYKRNGGLLN